MNSANEHRLGVFDGRRRVGTISYDALEEHFFFSYEPSWLVTPDAYPLSPHFPFSGEAVGSSTIRRFIENLLPEGRALDIVSTTHQISKNNVFGLLRALGGETTGALSFFSETIAPVPRPTTCRQIPLEELCQRIEARAQVPFAAWYGRVRMSIAGYQDKLPVYVKDHQFFLVEGELASTHILKPEPLDRHLAGLVTNEHFCMRLGARLGLRTAEVAILRAPHPVLVVRRFDREIKPDSVRRIHIIDTCQALDLPVAYKYERNFGSSQDIKHIRDGVSYERLFSTAVSCTTQKALTRLALTRWALLQYLIGNADAHGKNLSFYCRAGGLAIAPFYDLVSVLQYEEGIDHEFAMAYGDEFHFEAVNPLAWADFAKRAGLQRSFLAREMTRMGRLVLREAPAQAADTEYVAQERELVSRISDLVVAQATKLIAMAKPMLGVDVALL